MADKRIPDPAVFEKLGVFYLGAERESVRSGELRPVLYDSRDLTTHAVCVGMTGSGKTGLCTCLLEEAALDGIPAIAIDLKGDLANLALAFPGLSAAEFEPWVDPAAASRKGQTPAEYAAATADKWRTGLAQWGQDGNRIRQFRDSVELRIYTPGSEAGLPLSVLKSFNAPPPELINDGDAFRERISGAVSGLLALLGIEADPLRSREHILLATILDTEWRADRDCDLAALIRLIAKPPFSSVGVLDLDTFYPDKDRMGLAALLNNLLASPSFSAWATGEALDIDGLLRGPDGRPRLSVLYLAHLSDPERMFFVTMLFNEVVGWVRRQTGTGSLRALLYMDEVFGYLPPVANPPSKTPLLTLLKQARAFGLGLVLATQNPVDLDYKALSNAGTWLLGRLQTERDKARMIDGLLGAAAGEGRLDRGELEETLSGLDGREFLLHNVHADHPVVMGTRWAMSYLRGPLSRDHISQLTRGQEPDRTPPAPEPVDAVSAAATPPQGTGQPGSPRPLLPDAANERFIQPVEPFAGAVTYRPALLGQLALHYVNSRIDWDEWRDTTLLVELSDRSGADPWDAARIVTPPQLGKRPAKGAGYQPLPAMALKDKSYATWAKSLKGHAYESLREQVLSCKELKLTSQPGESARDFGARVAQELRETRDRELGKLHDEFATRMRRLQDRINRAEEKLADERGQYKSKQVDSFINVGSAILETVFGTRRITKSKLDRARSAAHSVGRTKRERDDITRARESLAKAQAGLEDLRRDHAAKLADLRGRHDPANVKLEQTVIAPRKSDIQVQQLSLVWLPVSLEN